MLAHGRAALCKREGCTLQQPSAMWQACMLHAQWCACQATRKMKHTHGHRKVIAMRVCNRVCKLLVRIPVACTVHMPTTHAQHMLLSCAACWACCNIKRGKQILHATGSLLPSCGSCLGECITYAPHKLTAFRPAAPPLHSPPNTISRQLHLPHNCRNHERVIVLSCGVGGTG